MKHILALFLISISTLFAAPTMPGSWTVVGDVQGYPIEEACSFTQAEEKITGSCINAGKPFPTTVTVTDDKVVFVHAGEYDGQPLTLTYSGKYTEKGDLAGTINVAPMGYDGTFTAKKADAK